MTSDYYPFGMAMPGRSVDLDKYRYGYNGMEKDPEMKGEGNSYTTEFRQYDPRLGRWLSIDPLMIDYPEISPYCAFNNNPVIFVDPEGLEATGGGNPAIYKDGGVYNKDGSGSNSQGGGFCSMSLQNKLTGTQFALKLNQIAEKDLNSKDPEPAEGDYFAKVRRVEKIRYRRASLGITVNGTLHDQVYQKEVQAYGNTSTGIVTISLDVSGITTTPVTINVTSKTGTVIFNGVVNPGTGTGPIVLPNAEVQVNGDGNLENYQGYYDVTITKSPNALPTDGWGLTINKVEQVIKHKITYYLFGWIPISRHTYKYIRTWSGTAIFEGETHKDVSYRRTGKEARMERRRERKKNKNLTEDYAKEREN